MMVCDSVGDNTIIGGHINWHAGLTMQMAIDSRDEKIGNGRCRMERDGDHKNYKWYPHGRDMEIWDNLPMRLRCAMPNEKQNTTTRIDYIWCPKFMNGSMTRTVASSRNLMIPTDHRQMITRLSWTTSSKVGRNLM